MAKLCIVQGFRYDPNVTRSSQDQQFCRPYQRRVVSSSHYFCDLSSVLGRCGNPKPKRNDSWPNSCLKIFRHRLGSHSLNQTAPSRPSKQFGSESPSIWVKAAGDTDRYSTLGHLRTLFLDGFALQNLQVPPAFIQKNRPPPKLCSCKLQDVPGEPVQ